MCAQGEGDACIGPGGGGCAPGLVCGAQPYNPNVQRKCIKGNAHTIHSDSQCFKWVECLKQCSMACKEDLHRKDVLFVIFLIQSSKTLFSNLAQCVPK